MSVNHIYKVVWSKTKGCYIVVSELAKRVGRNKAKAIVISSAAMAMAVSSVMASTVSATINQAGTGGNESVAFGEQSTAGGAGAVALGKTATASASGTVALGQETKAEKNNGVAIGKGAQSTEDSAIALGFGSKSTGNWSVAIGLETKANNKQAVAVGSRSQASGENSIAIGNAANASNEFSVALGSSTTSMNKFTTAVGGKAFANQEGATALGYEARATATNTIAIGNSAKAEQEGVLALGAQAYAKAADTIAIGNSATAKQVGDIIIGKDAKSRDQGGGRSIAIGFKAIAGSNRNGHVKDDASTEKRGDDGSVAIGTNAYTGLNKNNTAVNNSVALGAGAGVGYRSVGADGTPLGVGTDADDNTTVLVKAFGGTTSKVDYFKNTGAANKDGFFSFQGVDINEGTALGRNTRAIGDQSVAIGAQSVAGMGSIVIGGNDIQAYDQKNYFKAKNPNSGEAKGVNDYNAEVTPGTGKNGQPITITNKYKELVGVGLDRSWRASYGQDGSTVIGMQAHSTTPLGVAIGTNSIVRKGAFGATAIGSGASVVANAEAAVAIGMGSEARGNYAVAAGTAARAKESAVAFGYSSQADVNAVAVGNKSVSKGSAVAVGDESQAVEASVAVGQLAKAKKVADIAVGQGAVASGEQGAIAMGLGTQAQGDSSIMIGGSEITKVAAQTVNYQKEKKDAQGHTIIKSTKKTETIGGEQIERTIRSVEMENTSGTIQQAYGELTNGGTLNTTTLDYSSTTNKNGHGSISMGVHSLSTGDLGTAIGTGARVTKLGGVALGTGAISELQNGVAIGTGSRADMNSIGTRQTDISYDNEGKIVPFDSKKVAYTFYWAGGTNTSEGDVVSFGSPGAERQLKNVAAGRIADDSTDAINGSQLNSVTKRMSNGWSVEAEKDKTSSGVLKLNGALATKGTEVHSADGKTTTRENPGTATGNIDKIRLSDELKIRVGDNLVLHQEDASRPVYEDPDHPDRQTGTRVTSKFTYSLNPELTGLKSAQFKNDAGDTTTINGAGVTVTPVTAGKQPVSLTTTGLNNGGNVISNVAGNLPSTKNNDATTGSSNATTSQAAPILGNAANQVNPTNAATVSDVLNAGWNLQGNNKAVDFVKPYDTVNFVNGDGTTATVESTDGKTSTVKYSVNLGEGLKKDDNNNITVKAVDKSLTVGTGGVKVNPGDKSLKTTDAGLIVNTADKSLEVTDAGLKVKAGDNTLTTDEKGLKVNTGDIEPVTTGTNPGTVKVKDGDAGKIATVDSVVNAVNSAAWTATSAATSAGELGAEAKDQAVKAGDKVTFEADKNIKITQAGSKFTFATKDNVSFDTVQVGGDQGPKLSKSDAGDLKVSGTNGTDPVKVTNVKDGEISADSKDAINGSQFHKLANNTIQLKGQNGTDAATETKKQELNKKDGIAFTVKSSDGTLLEVSAEEDTITLKPKTATLTTGADGVPTADTTNGKLVTADQLVNTLTEMGWKATADKDGSGTVSGAATELIKAGDTVTFKAGDNLAVKQDGKNFIYSLQKELTGLTSAEFKNQAGDKTVINSDGVTITPATNGKQPVSLTKDGLNNGGNPITNVTSNLVNYTDPEVNGVQPAKNGLRNLDDNSVANTNAATVGDLRNMGWIVSSDKTTGAKGTTTATAYSEAVKNANEVRFVGEGSAIVSGKTEGNVRTITVKVDNQTGVNKTVTPVNYTKADGTKVYPQEVDNGDGTKTVKFFENPDGTGKEIPSTEVITSVNGPKGTTTPTTLSNIKSNLPNTKNSDTANTADAPSNATKSQGAPNITNKDGDKYINPNNAASVSDVLNAGWNLQGNGTEVDFVKAYDTVNFIDGEGTTATVASTDGKTSTVKYSVNLGKGLQKDDTGNTISVKPADSSLVVDDAGVKVNTGTINNVTTGDKPGTVEANNGDENKVATVGNVVNAINNAAWTATSAKTNDGELGKEATNQLVKSGDKVTFEADKNIKITQDGSKFTFTTKNDVSFDTVQVGGDQGPKLSKTDNGDLKVSGPNGTSKVKVTNVTSGLDTYGDNVPGTTDKNRGLVDLSKPENGQPKVSDNTAATVGDLRNMGWIVSADKKTGDLTNAYSDTVKNANEVKFVGAGTAIVSGDTVDGVRTITVKVDDQTSTNNAVTPVVYTDKDGNQVYPTGKKDKDGNQIFNTKPDGKGADVTGPVKTTINGPKGITSPTSLSNVKNNIPNVNDGSRTITNPDGTEKTGDVENINKAPLTAEEAAALANPKTKDGQANPKYIGNNAATVSDVLNAGWNLQNNGAARDFVKPFDTVNFVNGVNTTAVVTTSEDGTTSNVTYNVTGLPVTYTTADGTPVSKIGDDYYTVNDKGQPIDANGKPSTKVNKDGKPVDENGNVIKPIDTTANPLTSSLVNPNVKNTDTEPNKKTTDPTQLGNVTSGLHKYGDTVDGKEVPGSTKANHGLVDLSTPIDGSKPKVSDNTAATVGDLRNMGWIVSSDKTTGETDKAYTDTVKNANEVKFVGEGTAIVSGKTVDGVRTITVKVDDQVSTNNSVTPVNYTKADGTKVYPKMVTNPDTGKEELKFFENPDGSGAEVQKGDVVTSINGPEGTTSPTTLKNVMNNIPNVNDGTEDITKPDGTVVGKTPDNGNINKAPLTAEEAAALANPKTKDGQTNPKYIGNNAATVSDVLNAGWNLQNNGESRDFVKPYDTVNFVNGLGTTAVVTTREGNTASDVTFNVKAANGSVTVDENGVKVTTGEMKPAVGTDNKETGAIATPADPAAAKQLKDTLAAAEKDLSAARKALKEAEKALAANPKNPALQQAVADKKADVEAKQIPVEAAQRAHDEAGLNKVATVQNVAEAINNAGFNLKTSADGGEKLTGTKDDGELIKPSNTVEMVAGNNLTVKQDANGKITYATKDNVTFTNVDTGTLNVGSPNTYTDGKGNTYTKVGDKYYKPADVVNGAPKPDATPVDVTTPVTPVSPVTMKAEAAKPATNNTSDAQPSSALNITSKDGKPTQITGVGSTLNTNVVTTTPEGTATKPGAAPDIKPKTEDAHLVDLKGTSDAPVNKNAAATVGDLQNMGWVVSAKDGNGYKDVVKNANVVDFKGGNGIEINGTTLADGTREITVGIKEGEVTNKVTITRPNGKKIKALRVGKHFYKVDKDDNVTSIRKDENSNLVGTPLSVNPKEDTITNTGSGIVTGNTVANAIQASGWHIGLGETDKDFNKERKDYDKVNPNDHVKFVDGANANVSMVTVDGVNTDGIKEETTFVKVDVNRDLKIDSVTTGGTAVDKNGNNLVKVGDDYYKESDIDPVTKQPKANAKPVPKADVTPAKDGAMIVKNADGKDVVSASVGKDGSGEFAVKGKDGKDGISMTAKDGQGAIGVNGKDGATTTIKGDAITIKDKEGNTNTSTPTTNVLKDTNGNTNTSDAAGTTYKDKDDNTAVVGPKEIALTDKSGDNKTSFTNKDLIFNAKDPKTGVEKTSHVSGDKIAFTTTDEMEKVFDKDGKPVIDPATGKQKEVIKNPGNSTEYTNEGLKVIPNDIVARDANGSLTFLDKDGKPVSKDTDGTYKYVGQDGKPGKDYTGAVEALKPNVVDNTRVISFGKDKPVLDSNGNPVKGPDGKPVMTEGISAGMQQIHNVAPGTKDTDAVNVSQLRGTTININNRINRSGAQAAALAGLQSIQYDPLEPTQISAGVGYYQGASALALGVNHYKNESTMFHVGASFNGYGSEVMANASVTWKFGARADETAVKDTFRQGPISASYTLQDKVSALEAQTRVQKEQLKTIKGLEKQVEMLKELNEKQQEQIAELFKRLSEK
ncbi:ESPR-type extended signal peptide-containing protein [Veillonella sp. CHU740]|uniref:ESPR-type extended signal peptide-containing protein n=1 Tax=Veillonella sp. CHU740 TaxID=2490950 RepID=UPI000F8C9F24|nr:ESPR-type extended signal peptide-containing protein [Veillonella sp. CHU740]